MQYQTINPYTEELVRTFPLHTDAEIESIIAKAEKTYETDWSREIACGAQGDHQEGGVASAGEPRRIRRAQHAGDGQVVPRGTVGSRIKRGHPRILCGQRGDVPRS